MVGVAIARNIFRRVDDGIVYYCLYKGVTACVLCKLSSTF